MESRRSSRCSRANPAPHRTRFEPKRSDTTLAERTLSDWLAYIERLHPRSIDLGLERVVAVLDALDLREPPYAIVTVGGTNGKGSTVAMCEAMLRAGGYRVGSYMSPHLVRYNERVRIDGQAVSDDALCVAFERVEARRRDVQLTYFEYGTIAALDILRNAKVEIGVLEVGMGGRLDAVNAVDPDAAIVTSVGVDHTNWLGPDRESIGREKAGIFRAARPAICGDLDPPQSLLETASRVDASLYLYGRDFSATPTEGGWTYECRGRRRSGLPFPALRGDYQLRNAACALTALDTVADRFPLTQAQVRDGLLAAFVPGRFQVLPGLPSTILDVAHNADAARVFAANLRRHRVAGRTYAVFGMLADKDIAAVAQTVADQVDGWYVASLPGPRGGTAEDVSAMLTKAGVRAPIERFARVVEAYEAACARATPIDRVLVFGSFYTVGDILAHLDASS
ncbi:MAG: bifunctional tetrahydrofolate synthase/dihydrofolate synthase, partial [Sulfurifustis sp.]